MNYNIYFNIGENEYTDMKDSGFISDWITENLTNIRNYYIWGKGKDGYLLFDCMNAAKLPVNGFIVGNGFSIDEEGERTPTYTPSKVKDLTENDVVIIASRKYENDIERQILLLCPCVKVLCFKEIYSQMVRDYLLMKKKISPQQMIEWDADSNVYFAGRFDTWEEAEKYTKTFGKGYASDSIYERVCESVQKVRNGTAAFERDGVAFSEMEYKYEILSALLYVQNAEGSLNVCDFGGSLGSTFFQNRKLLGSTTTWSVVEQRRFVEYGQNHIPEINYYLTMEDCFFKQDINCILLSGVLQYLPDPYLVFKSALNSSAKYIIIDRTPMTDADRDYVAYQNVPKSVYKAVYPAWMLTRQNFMNALLECDPKRIKIFDWKNSERVQWRNSNFNEEYYGGLYAAL